MVGKLQDIMTAAVVVGAAENAKFVVDTRGMQTDNEPATKPKQPEEMPDEEIYNIEPGTFDEETVDLMTKELNDLMNKIDCNLEFDYHQEVGVMSIRMIDKETQDVIKELPPEEMVLNMMKAKIWIGAFIDKTI